MEYLTHSSASVLNAHTKKSYARGFLVRFLKHFVRELFVPFFFIFRFLNASFQGNWGILVFPIDFIKSVFKDFPQIALGFGFIFSTCIVYVAGTYLTLLPQYIVFALLFLPNKIRFPVLGLSAFFSLFIIFLI